MALIEEAGAQADFGDRAVGLGQFSGSPFNTETADVLSDRAPIVDSEHPGEVGRMNAHLACHR